jgi:predicted DNA-binding transcriptional regulator YafY
MQFEKYRNRIVWLEELIRRESTGTPEELANRLGISVRMVFRHIDYFRENGRALQFDRSRRTYRFID